MPDFRYVICDVFTDRPLEGNPNSRRSPLLSPIGLEPVINDPGPEPAPPWPEAEVTPLPAGGLEAD